MSYTYKFTHFNDDTIEIVPTFTVDGYKPPYIVSRYIDDEKYSVRYRGFEINTYADIDTALYHLQHLCETYKPALDKFKNDDE